MTEIRTPQAADKYIVRFPEGMRDLITDMAKQNNRSMNAEIIARLQDSFSSVPKAYADVLRAGLEATQRVAKLESLVAADFAKSLLKYGDQLRGMYAAIPDSEKNKADFLKAFETALEEIAHARRYLITSHQGEEAAAKELRFTDPEELQKVWEASRLSLTQNSLVAQGKVISKLREDGTLALLGDPQEIAARLRRGHIDRFIPMKGGICVGIGQVEEALVIFPLVA